MSPVLRSGDTVITIPRLVHQNGPGPDTYVEAIRESRAVQHASLIEARDLALQWAGVAPNNRQPHEYLGRAFLRLGGNEAAAAELERAATLGTPESRRGLFWERVEALVRSDHGEDVRRSDRRGLERPGTRYCARARLSACRSQCARGPFTPASRRLGPGPGSSTAARFNDS